MVADGERIAILVIAELELAFVIGDQSSFGVKPDDNGVPLQCVRERLARVTSPRRSRMALQRHVLWPGNVGHREQIP